MTREYIIGIRAGLKYALHVLDMEKDKAKTKPRSALVKAREQIKSDIADITRTLEK